MARFLELEELFEGRHFDREIIVLCVRWYLRFKLSFRGLVEMMETCFRCNRVLERVCPGSESLAGSCLSQRDQERVVA